MLFQLFMGLNKINLATDNDTNGHYIYESCCVNLNHDSCIINLIRLRIQRKRIKKKSKSNFTSHYGHFCLFTFWEEKIMTILSSYFQCYLAKLCFMIQCGLILTWLIFSKIQWMPKSSSTRAKYSVSFESSKSGLYSTLVVVVLWAHDVIKWKHFPCCWPFVRGIHRPPVYSPHKGQWCRAVMFSLIWAWINVWVNNRDAGDLRRLHAHYDFVVMIRIFSIM